MALDTQELLNDLTDEQRRAVTHVDGPLLIIAGAGSGKTRVITRRVAYLLSLGVAPETILAITFTNKAAGEMKGRVSDLLGRPLRDFGRLDQRSPLICTFHSLGMRILRYYHEAAGLAPSFGIYDSSDQEKLIKEALKAADLSTTNYPVGVVHAAISGAKNKLQGADAYAAAARSFPFTQYARVYRHYQQLLKQNNALDFDDLLLRTAELLREKPEVLRDLQQRFSYILIDEYQDTNHAQYVVAHALAQGHRNMCVVGDPDQSIYAWRGADIQNILDFEKDYPDAVVVKLEQNYRSTQTILDIASKVIANNRQRKEKRLWSDKGDGPRARLLLTGDEHEEAFAVARELKKLQAEKDLSWSDMAVFYRINALSRVMEDALRREVVPYRVARGVDFYHRKEIKDLLAYLKVIANPDDELSLARIINVPARGIGDNGVKQMQVFAMNQGLNLWQTLERAGEVPNMTTRTLNGIRSFVQLVKHWRRLAAMDVTEIPPSTDGSPRGRMRALMEDLVRTSGLEAYYRKADPTSENEVPNIGELISSGAQFDEENPEGTLDDYLAQVSLVSDIDALKDAGGAVTLMTLHSAKGLEFPVVAMIGMEEGALPHARVREHPEQLEEERRLCFVGITRAQQHLILSKANYRQIRGLRERTAASRFLAEMPSDLLEVVDQTGGSHGFDDDRASERAIAQEESARLAGQFRPGQRVRHPQFGVGTIAEISEMGQHTRAVVEFQRAGRKTLILQYTRLEPA